MYLKQWGSVLISALLSMTYACSTSEVEEEEIKPEDKLEVTSAFFPAKSYGSSKKIELGASKPWRIELDAKYSSWLTVTPTEGNGNGIEEITITAKRNEEKNKEREAVFKIIMQGDEEISTEISILQPTEYFLMQDSTVLRRFYEALDGDNWTIKWPTNMPVRSWPGLFIGEASKVERVTSIWFSQGINMKGELPEEIGDLDALIGFAIKDEPKVTGTIPGEAFAKTNIEQIWLNNTSITGKIPAALTKCDNLMSMNFDDNKLNGFEDGFENKQWPKLVGFFIQNNEFEGAFNADWIFGMKKLTIFSIKNNRFSGKLPNSLVAGLSGLLQMEISGNCFTGDFPNAVKSSVAYQQTEVIDMCPQREGFGFTPGTCER